MISCFRYIRQYEFELDSLSIKPNRYGGVVIWCERRASDVYISFFIFKKMEEFNKQKALDYLKTEPIPFNKFYLCMPNFSNVENKILDAIEDQQYTLLSAEFEEIKMLQVSLLGATKSKIRANEEKASAIEIIKRLYVKEMYERRS